MNATNTCLMCQPADDQCIRDYCPRLAPPGTSGRPRRSQASPRRQKGAGPTPTLDIGILSEADESETGIGDAVPYRAVVNRAGRTIMARPGTRPCGPRCQSAQRPNCACSCGGRNHGIRRDGA